MIAIAYSWTLSGELCNLTGTKTLQDALTKLGLIDHSSIDFFLKEGAGWARGGAETYIYQFWLSTADTEKALIIKACTTLSDIDQTISEWLRRRAILASEGISVPTLYISGNGLIVEEFVPFSLRSVLITSGEDTTWNLLEHLVEYVRVLVKFKFSPVDFVNDLRSHGDDVVVIDFGQDLGPPSFSFTGLRESYHELLRKLQAWVIEVAPAKQHLFRQYFLSTSNQDSDLSAHYSH